MSFVARPTIPAPKASYVEGLRAKEREGKKTTARAAAAAAPKQSFKTALVLNGQRQRVAPQAGSGQLPQHQGELGPERDYVARSAHG